ncbi:MAG: hypothetical protein E7578_07825 [Ruminococcaceae bacterium]|nr:hypothetical protein [Oscillospiraceae bacterium]
MEVSKYTHMYYFRFAVSHTILMKVSVLQMNVGLVIVMGVSIVFIGLVCIVLLCKIMSAVVAISEKATPAAPSTVKAQPVNTPAPAAASVSPDPGPRGEVVAAIAAVLAEELGEDVSAIRILSLKKVN